MPRKRNGCRVDGYLIWIKPNRSLGCSTLNRRPLPQTLRRGRTRPAIGRTEPPRFTKRGGCPFCSIENERPPDQHNDETDPSDIEDDTKQQQRARQKALSVSGRVSLTEPIEWIL